MKRLILILCSILILNIVCVNAAEMRDLKVRQNSITGRCTLSGNTDEPAGTMLSILISKSSEKDKPIFLSGAIVGENGKIAYDFYMPQTAAPYTLRETAEATVISSKWITATGCRHTMHTAAAFS